MDKNKKSEERREPCILLMSQLVMPHQANVMGYIHGGEMMKIMDNAAAAVAMKYSKSNCVTARVDELEFHSPVLVGELVTCTAAVVFTGTTSMEVLVSVESEELNSDLGAKKALSAYFTMVALDKKGKPQSVPIYKPQTEEEKELYQLAKQRVQKYKNKGNRG